MANANAFLRRSRDQWNARSKVRSPLPTVKELWLEVIPTGRWLVAALVASVILSIMHSPIAALPAVVTMLVIPGAALLSCLHTRPLNIPARVVLSVCLSMMIIMLEGLAASLILQPLGVSHPLAAPAQSVIWFVLALVILVACGIQRRDPVTWALDGVTITQVTTLLASGVLVLIAVLGVARLNHTGSRDLSVFSVTLDVAVLLFGVFGVWSGKVRLSLNTMLYSASLAFLLSTSLRGWHLYGWDIQQEFGVAAHTVKVGAWDVPANHDPYASMLSLTVLPTVLHSLVKLRLLAFFQLVVPAILALLPVAVFSTVQGVPRWITSGRSAPRSGLAFAVVVGLIISSVAYSQELVSITRQAMAMTLMAALVMVLFDRFMLKRDTQIVAGLVIVTIAFTHYTTSYLLAGIFICAWIVSHVWSKGWLGTPREKLDTHRYAVQSRKIINGTLVIVAAAAAFGWNLIFTRNYALKAPASALTSQGAGFTGAALSGKLSLHNFVRVLISQIKLSAPYIVPVRGSSHVHLANNKVLNLPGLISSIFGGWNEINFLTQELLWILLGFALLYGLFYLARRRPYEFSADLVGLGVAGLMVGGLLRFSGTLATFYSPERAAIFTAILLAPALTLFLDDVVSYVYRADRTRGRWVVKSSLAAAGALLTFLIVQASGLGVLIVGGQPPGGLSAKDVNTENFTISAPELASAVWIHNHVRYPSIVQTDLFGQLVMLSQPGSYDLIDEIVPATVDRHAYVYLSPVNIWDDLSQAEASGGSYQVAYHSNLGFFNQNFYVVYSTGATRIYH